MMILIREFEERFLELRDQKNARGGVAVSVGQEAVSVGVCSALRTDDYITSTHRGHGHCLAKGASPARLLAEFLGRSDGYCGGKGGAMHVAAPEIGIMGTNGIVGAGIPIANGLALASKKSKRDQVTVSFSGDGASNTGAFHEAVNLASAWRLPVIFICENNLYAISTKISKTTGSDQLYKRAEALGMVAFCVDGNNVIEVYDAALDAVNRARRGEGPTFIECLTYRKEGWAWKDRERGLLHYRDETEWQEWIERCPIKRYREHLTNNGFLTQEFETEIYSQVKLELDDAFQYALNSPEPDLSVLEKDVFAT